MPETRSGRPGRRPCDLRPLWVGVSVFGATVVFGFGLALWVVVLGGDRTLAQTWRFAVSCFAGPV